MTQKQNSGTSEGKKAPSFNEESFVEKEHVPSQKQAQEQAPEQEYKELLQRVQADFENYKKHVEKRILDIKEYAAKGVLLQIIPILDNLELALQNTTHQNHDEFIKGVALIHTQLTSVLRENGVEAIDTRGKIFDPYSHEALLKAESDEPENTVIEEFQKGFILHGQVIRHAKVKVSAGRKKESDKEQTNSTDKQTKNNDNGGKDQNDK